jgi:hypothetical protein
MGTSRGTLVIATVLLSIVANATAGSGHAPAAALKAARSFDKDHNRVIDTDELKELNKAFVSAPYGPLAGLDRNKDGKIAAAEVELYRPAASAAHLRQVDQDRNHVIEGDEVTALRAEFAKATSGPLSAIDRNHDLQLDDDEIARLNQRLAEQSAQRKKRQSTTQSTPVVAEKPPSDVGTGSAVLKWSPPTKNSDGTALENLAGYAINYGRSPGAMTRRVVVNDPQATSHVIENLGDGTWYFTVAAMTKQGAESRPGPVVSKNVVSGASAQHVPGQPSSQ